MQQPPSNILNVAEMLLHGVADHEIIELWLTSISCKEFVKNFIDSGYDMPTISRVTPQDLTAIGITDPIKRSKIISEIKKLNLQDGIPSFKPANLNHWLSLLRLDSCYYKSLCDQNIDTIDKVCQLTWEDFEELGIAKLGHQKRLLIAIERLKELENAESKKFSKTLSEPIYDTNSSQILLVPSGDNHCINGPIINKQSSTSELSSTGSGSMHSIYSASSHNHQPNSHAVHQTSSINNNSIHNSDKNARQQQSQQQTQAIHNQAPTSRMHQLIMQASPQSQPTLPEPPALPPMNFNQQSSVNSLPSQHQFLNPSQRLSHYQSMTRTQFHNFPIYGNKNDLSNHSVPQQTTNRQSLGQMPFAALANLPKHQQQLLQQSSIYATLSRQPQRVKQPPPPVPIRTNSLKSNSLMDEEDNRQRNEQFLRSVNQSPLLQQQRQTQTIYGTSSHLPASANNMFANGRMVNKSSYSTQLQKNKSFSGNAHMDAARARFLNRNNSQQQLQQQIYAATSNLTNHIRNLTNGANHMGLDQTQALDSNEHRQNDIYGILNMPATISNDSPNPNLCEGNRTNGHMVPTVTSAYRGATLINVTTGRDDDFPPPPSPLSMADYDAQTISESA